MSVGDLFRRKSGDETEHPEHEMRRHLGPWHLTFMGVGGTIGAGIFVLSGTVAANYAGPAVCVSYVLAAIACGCAALCYAEFASMSPSAGSAYLYTYRSLGEFPAWMVGWSLILEYLFSAATVAVGWSGYFAGVLASLGVPLPASIASAPFTYAAGHGLAMSSAMLNLPALMLVIGVGLVLIRGIGESAWLNMLLMLVKVGVILLVIGLAAPHVDPRNWVPFVPQNTGAFGHFGLSGIFRGAGVVFFAYVGFDMISSGAQESRNPRRDLPIALLATLVICTLLYVAMALVMTGLAPYPLLNVPNPIVVALNHAGHHFSNLSLLVGVAAIAGLASALMVSMYGQTRIFLAMARDGFLPPALSRLNPRTLTPVFGTGVVVVAVGLVAALMPVQLLGELASIGTLLAFIAVCVGLIVMRRTEPHAHRGFRVPGGDLIPIGGAASCAALMATLPADTWIRLGVWSLAGLLIYLVYGLRRRTSRLAPDTTK
jgi:APA family basic amino acid/polyamine antiporter